MKTTHKTYKCFGWIFILLSNFTLHSILFNVPYIFLCTTEHWFSQLLLALSVFISLIPLVTFLILLFFYEPKLTDFQHSRLERRKTCIQNFFAFLKSFYWNFLFNNKFHFLGFLFIKAKLLGTPLPYVHCYIHIRISGFIKNKEFFLLHMFLRFFE